MEILINDKFYAFVISDYNIITCIRGVEMVYVYVYCVNSCIYW